MSVGRVFDETRLTSRGLGRQWYAGLFAWSLPVICAAAWMANPAQAQEQSRKQGKAEVAAGQANINSASDDPGPIPQTVENLPELIPVTRVTPEYPYLAQVTGAAGTVEIVATVAPNGHVIGVQVIRGFPMLQQAAASAVLQWVYAPQPAQTRTIAYVTFFSDEMPKSPGSIQPAQLISRKEPVYPEQARQTGVKGLVQLVATIGTDGRVKSVHTVKGDPLLVNAAREAVLQWIYKPTLLNGTPVEAQTRVLVNFMGEQSDNPPPSSELAAFQPAVLIRRTEPVNPGGDPGARGGTVVFKARIGLDGHLSNIRVTDGSAELVTAALEAVKQWVYRPATRDGQPVETDTEITLRFGPGR